jgi:hypothetical protein
LEDKTACRERSRIDVAELNYVEVTKEGQRLCLHVLDQGGKPATVSLPVDCLNTVVNAVPPLFQNVTDSGAPQKIHQVDSWALSQDAAGLVLKLSLPDSSNIAFSLQSWQIEAIASLVFLGTPPARGRLH